MSRLVRAATTPSRLIAFSSGPVNVKIGDPGVPAVGDAAHGGATQVDNYAVRIAKYVPAEVIAFYLAADKLFVPVAATPVQGGADAGTALVSKFIDAHGSYFAAGIFLVALIATPLYILQQSEKNQPWGIHAVMSSVAFVIWSYATQGALFLGNGLYDARLGSIAVLVYTLLSGFVIPSKSAAGDQG